MTKKINFKPPVLLEWVAEDISGIELKQFPTESSETSLKEVINLSNNGGLAFLWLKPSKPEYRESIIFGVDYKTGEHIINGNRLNLVPEEIKNIPNLHFRPFFYKRMRMDFSEQGEPIGQKRIHRYLFGWKTTVNDKNHQRFVSIDPMTGSVAEILEKR